MKIWVCDGLVLFLVLEWSCVAPPVVEAFSQQAIKRDFLFARVVSIARHATHIVVLDAKRRFNSEEEPQQAAAGTHPPANNNTGSSNSSSPRYRHRQIQLRRKPINRRPKYYWSNVTNLELEFRYFWKSVQVTIRDNEPVPIPNEALLNYYQRFDIKAAIVTHGGREDLSFLLGGSRIMAGKWNEAVSTSPELQQLLLQNRGLSPDLPPSSPQQQQQQQQQQQAQKQLPKKQPKTTKGKKSLPSIPDYDNDENYDLRKLERWSHKTGRKESGYWNDTLVIQELYEYLEQQRVAINRPSVFMPRLSELDQHGRQDLRHAICRFTSGGGDGAGGAKRFCKMAGLITFREWSYFEGLYELLLELKLYLDQYHGGNYQEFPVVSEVKNRGHELLHTLIQYYGGRKFVASKLGMSYSKTGRSYAKRRDGSSGRGEYTGLAVTDMYWGDFDLEFGIALLSFVRTRYLAMRPPLQNPVLEMPSRDILLTSSDDKTIGAYLDQQIHKFGGYENVARRLGLEVSFRF